MKQEPRPTVMGVFGPPTPSEPINVPRSTSSYDYQSE